MMAVLIGQSSGRLVSLGPARIFATPPRAGILPVLPFLEELKLVLLRSLMNSLHRVLMSTHLSGLARHH